MLPTEYRQLQQGQSVNKNSKLLTLQPFMSDKLIRVGGRLSNSYLPLHNKHQVIINKNHPLASLLIIYIYERNSHCGRELTLSLLREKYWIIHAKALIRKVISNCKRLTIQLNAPMMGNLPCERYPLENLHSLVQVSTTLGHYLSQYVKGLEYLQVQENVLV